MIRSLRVQHQLFVALVAPALFVIFLVAYFAEVVAARALETALGARLIVVAESAAALLDPRLLLLEPGDDASRPARGAIAKLERLKDATDVERIFLVRLGHTETETPAKDDDLLATAILDTSSTMKVGDAYGRAQFDRHELGIVRTGQGAASFLFRSIDGRLFKTGYAPFLDQTGAVAGIVGVDAPANYHKDIEALRGTVAVVALAGVVLLTLLAVLSARTVATPLSRLSQAAQEIGEGRLNVRPPDGGPKEIALLSNSMQKMAKALKARDEEMQMMVAGIAHEVRNPLGGIELFGGLLKDDLDDEDPRKGHVLKILRELGVLSRVVNDFLSFARSRKPELKRVPLRELVEDVPAIVRPQAERGEISVTVEINASDGDAGLDEVQLDPDAMKRAILNLAQNAVQAAPKGGRVLIRATRTEGGLEISVEDDGPGVPEPDRAAIFRPFFTTRQQGTGLGLALAKKTVEDHGGTLDVSESPWGGARFRIRLPVC
ncbi:MAG: HAMP domain-containing histidine kinase [Deltaproteobacteria bacterium]|nr:HAMP domain-containing histidine kinase [Deltaproteobacteria bacterium]